MESAPGESLRLYFPFLSVAVAVPFEEETVALSTGLPLEVTVPVRVPCAVTINGNRSTKHKRAATIKLCFLIRVVLVNDSVTSTKVN